MRKHILLALFLGLVLLAAGSLAEGKTKVSVSSYTLIPDLFEIKNEGEGKYIPRRWNRISTPVRLIRSAR